MSLLFMSALLLLLLGCLSGSCSPTPGGTLETQGNVMLQHQHQTESQDNEQTGPAVTPCPSCALSQVQKEATDSDGQSDMVEAVKRHILNMLHLSARPNITHPVPRAALLNAIRKLHVGRVSEDGSVEMEEESGGDQGGQSDEQPSEIITFAEPGDTPDVVKFDISREGSAQSVVEQANVWLFVKLAKGSRAKGKVSIQLLESRPGLGGQLQEEIVSEKAVDVRRSGWHTLSVARDVQALLDGENSVLNLRVSCPLCAEAGATPILAPAAGVGEKVKEREQSHRPFLMVVLRPKVEPLHRRSKRGLECDGKIRICCKRQFYVNFKDIGWSDWIIAPSGYHANYCEGDCPSHVASITGTSLSFHSTVINHYRMRGYSPFTNIKSCCVPTRLRAMSMLYYNEEQKIIKKDIQNMIVEECGCS